MSEFVATLRGGSRSSCAKAIAGRLNQSLQADNGSSMMTMNGNARPRALLGAIAVLAGGLFAWPGGADACTRLLWNENKLAVLAGRSMDWPESTQPVLTVLPRGMARDGGRAGPEVVVKDNPARWTSKYGSMVTTSTASARRTGFNEQGLGAHMLYLKLHGLRTARPGEAWSAGRSVGAVSAGQRGHSQGSTGAAGAASRS